MHPLMPREQTHQIVRLNTHQVLTLAKLAREHEGQTAHIFQNVKTKIVEVEFLFPDAYIVATNGRAIKR